MDRVKARQPGGMKELKTVFSDVQMCLGEISRVTSRAFVRRLRAERNVPLIVQLDPRAAYAETPRFAEPFPELIDGAEETDLLGGTGSNRAVAF